MQRGTRVDSRSPATHDAHGSVGTVVERRRTCHQCRDAINCGEMSVIEMVPNVSEGRRAAVIDELASVLRGTAGATLLNTTSDPSHNRSVFTLVGSGEALLDATLRMFEVALHIDLRSHQGAHPRIGAVDVVPAIRSRARRWMRACNSRTKRGVRLRRATVPIYFYERRARPHARSSKR